MDNIQGYRGLLMRIYIGSQLEKRSQIQLIREYITDSANRRRDHRFSQYEKKPNIQPLGKSPQIQPIGEETKYSANRRRDHRFSQ